MRSPPIAAKSAENISIKSFGCISLMSAPAANAFSLPVTRMQPILSSASRSSTAAAISRNTPNDKALSIFGRFSVMMPTAPLLSTMMVSNVLISHPAKFCGQCARWRDGLQVGSGSDAPRCVRARRELRHEHPRGGGNRQQCTEGDEDLSDQRGLIPGRVIAAGGGRYAGAGLDRGCCHRDRLRGLSGLLQRAIAIIELVGCGDLALGGRLGGYLSGYLGRRLGFRRLVLGLRLSLHVGSVVRLRQQNRVGAVGHGPGGAGRLVELRIDPGVGVGD